MASSSTSKPATSISSLQRIILIAAASIFGLLLALMFRGTSPFQLLNGASRSISNSTRATGLIAKSGIELLTFGTPNGHKAAIMLEELKEAYNKSYVWQSIPINENVQKEAWFTKLNPNGKIPVIVDHDKGKFAVFEGAAILAYLTRRYDPERKFSFEYDSDDYSTCEQWVAWQHGALGPLQGQSGHFYRMAKERIPYPTQRYLGEVERLYGILDARLASRDYHVGPGRGKYSIADIASFSWVNVAYLGGIDVKKWPNVHAWAKRIDQRPAVKTATSIPSPSKFINRAYEERLVSEDGFKEKEEELKKIGDAAKEQYTYKYASP